ncbi:hypothetical protein G9F73_010410 [Clostridium estertheticum]|uniref:hypothetical protein n=1 Tax=Clostridium estertheticum TaxID=238834 RepID=UPI0013EEB551|nr:hypothetical protein [Clostridium estertheticum]MBZ9608217.1 hypothetical protein [Clostridium estertheticum]
MSLANSFYDFKKEIDLIIKQNPLECELYSIIAAIIRERDSSKSISLREVSALKLQTYDQNQTDRMYKINEAKYASSDFLIISLDYRYSERETKKILGVIEVKALYLNLEKEKNSPQFNGELKTFGKLIYTNGIEWRFYEYNSDLDKEELVWKVILGEYYLLGQDKPKISDEDKIEWHDVSNWHLLLNKIDKIDWNATK